MEVSQPGATASSSPPVITLKIIYHRQKIFRVTFYSGTYQSGYVDKISAKMSIKCPKIRDFGAAQFWLCTDISDWDPRFAIVATFWLSPEPDESCVHLDTEQSRCAPQHQLLRKYFYNQTKQKYLLHFSCQVLCNIINWGSVSIKTICSPAG